MRLSRIKSSIGTLVLAACAAMAMPSAYAQENDWQKFLRDENTRLERQRVERDARDERDIKERNDHQRSLRRLPNDVVLDAPRTQRSDESEQANRTTTRMVNTPNGLKMCRTIGAYETCH